MFNDSQISQNTSLERLRHELKECRNKLLDIMSEWDHINNEIQPRLVFEYNNLFGNIEDEIHFKNSVNTKLERKLELLSIKASRGEKITQKTIEIIERLVEKDTFENSSASRFRFKLSPSQDIMERLSAIDKLGQDTSSDLSFYYRAVVKKLHPDMEGQTDLFKQYWDSVVEAYKSKDLNKLKIFYKLICEDESIYLELDEDSQRKLQKEIFDLKMHIQVETRKIKRTIEDEPFCYADNLNDKSWIIKRRRHLKEKLMNIQVQISQNNRILTSFKKINYSEINPDESATQFQSSFYDNTYSRR
jgi:hypothetical protein